MPFRVQHLDHLGSIVSSHSPVGGSLTYSFKAGQPGDISYELPMSDVAIGRDAFAPYKTDFRLERQPPGGGNWQPLIAGIHTSVNLKNDTDTVSVSGKDWAHYLEQPVFFAYYKFNWSQAGATETNRRKDIIKADHARTAGVYDVIWAIAYAPPASQKDIVTHLISKAGDNAAGNSVGIVPKFIGNAAASQLTTTALVIMFQDTTTILQHINNLGQLEEPYGFDWTMNHTKNMEFFGPRKTIRQSPTPIWNILKTNQTEQEILSLDWTNNGPIGTHVVGLSIGSPALWWHKKDQESIDKFRAWLKIEHVGDQYIKGPDMRYALDGLDYIHPQKDVKIVVDPSLLSLGFQNHIGDVVRVKWDFPPYHEVNAYYWITEQSFSDDTSGNWKCTLGLQQIYDKI